METAAFFLIRAFSSYPQLLPALLPYLFPPLKPQLSPFILIFMAFIPLPLTFPILNFILPKIGLKLTMILSAIAMVVLTHVALINDSFYFQMGVQFLLGLGYGLSTGAVWFTLNELYGSTTSIFWGCSMAGEAFGTCLWIIASEWLINPNNLPETIQDRVMQFPPEVYENFSNFLKVYGFTYSLVLFLMLNFVQEPENFTCKLFDRYIVNADRELICTPFFEMIDQKAAPVEQLTKEDFEIPLYKSLSVQLIDPTPPADLDRRRLTAIESKSNLGSFSFVEQSYQYNIESKFREEQRALMKMQPKSNPLMSKEQKNAPVYLKSASTKLLFFIHLLTNACFVFYITTSKIMNLSKINNDSAISYALAFGSVLHCGVRAISGKYFNKLGFFFASNIALVLLFLVVLVFWICEKAHPFIFVFNFVLMRGISALGYMSIINIIFFVNEKKKVILVLKYIELTEVICYGLTLALDSFIVVDYDYSGCHLLFVLCILVAVFVFNSRIYRVFF